MNVMYDYVELIYLFSSVKSFLMISWGMGWFYLSIISPEIEIYFKPDKISITISCACAFLLFQNTSLPYTFTSAFCVFTILHPFQTKKTFSVVSVAEHVFGSETSKTGFLVTQLNYTYNTI